MNERLRSDSYAHTNYKQKKMGDDYLGPGKTMVILVIVVGCFAVLCPNVFYPMFFGSSQNRIKPSPLDRTAAGCCDVISEKDVNTIRIMSQLCSTIIKKEDGETELTGRELVTHCQKAVLETCGIDISAVLQERVILGRTTKQILDEIRSLNGSMCLKYNFGVPPWRLGVPHRVTVNVDSSASIRQERPAHLRSEMLHPAFRERGRAIPAQQPSPSRPPPRIVEGKPGPIPGMRPTIGGAGKVVPPPKQTTGTMGLIMPIYTIGIVILFTYTVMKVLFKKQQESLYPHVEPDPVFRREVFEANRGHTSTYTKEAPSNKLVVNAMSALLDQVDKELSARAQHTGIVGENAMDDATMENHEDQGSVKVVGMEMTASFQGNKKWASDSPVISPPVSSTQAQPVEAPHDIYLEGALPPQSNHLLVADAATETQQQKLTTNEDPAVVLAGKMTLSVLSLNSENGIEEYNNDGRKDERSSSNVSEDFEKIDSAELMVDHLHDIIQDISTNKEEDEIVVESKNNSENPDNSSIEEEKILSLSRIRAEIETPLPEKNENSQELDKEETRNVLRDTQTFSAQNKNPNGQPSNEVSRSVSGYMSNFDPISEMKNNIIDKEEQQINDMIEAVNNINSNFIDGVKTEDTVETGKSVSENDMKPSDNSIIQENVEKDKLSDMSELTDVLEITSMDDASTKIQDEKPKDTENLLEEPPVTQSIVQTEETNGQSVSPTICEDNRENEENNEDEEGEQELDSSDIGDTDDEIQDIDRIDNTEESVNVRVNGSDSEQIKIGTTSNDVLDENLSFDDDDSNIETVEEIVEYVTDEEEVEEEVAEVPLTNNINHLDQNSTGAN